jgi:hypothetical protein
MPAPLAVAAAGIAVAGLITSFIGSRKAAKAAKKEAKEEARLEGLVTGEKIRTLGIDERTLYGETVAGYAGGGVQGMQPNLGATNVTTGSPMSVLAEQKKSFAAEKDIIGKVGASKASAALTRGKNLADKYRWSGYANVASSASNILANYSAMKGP